MALEDSTDPHTLSLLREFSMHSHESFGEPLRTGAGGCRGGGQRGDGNTQ